MPPALISPHPLQLYSEYISRFDKALKTLEECTKKNPQFAKVLREFEAQPMCAHLPLAGYMLETVQRIPRYKLLLAGQWVGGELGHGSECVAHVRGELQRHTALGIRW